MVIVDVLLNRLLLLLAQTDVADLATSFADRQNQNRMALAAVTFGATGLVANGALEQRATKQLGSGKIGSQFIATSKDVFLFHLI